jgi:glutamate decarboxylase
VDRYSVFDVSRGLRERGWQVPAYTFPENREDLAALRMVVRNGYSKDPADIFRSFCASETMQTNLRS